MNTNKFVRINHYITVPQVRLVDDQGRSEILNTYEAKERANQAELDLVEIVPQARPPVCKIMDFGKWKYEENIKTSRICIFISSQTSKRCQRSKVKS
jgi:translation initiation factor IF-3